MPQTTQATVLALDVGSVRVGVAIADLELRFAAPLATLDQDDSIWQQLHSLVEDNKVQRLVVGLPRGLDGQETAQTSYARTFASKLQLEIDLPVIMQDEAATSIKAKEELESRGKPYAKGDVDALAATYILDDYLGELGDADATL